VRCVGCEKEPPGPARFCECCGCEIPPGQNEAEGTPRENSGLYEWAPNPGSWDLRCPSCAGPSLDGGRCQACQASSVKVEPAKSAEPEKHVAVNSLSSSAPSAASSHGPSESANPAKAHSPRALPEVTAMSLKDKAAGARIEATGTEVLKTGATVVRRQKIDAPHTEKTLRPVVVSRLPNVPVPPKPQRRMIVLAAAFAVVAVIGVSDYWLRTHEQPVFAQAESPVIVPEEQPATLVASDRVTNRATAVAVDRGKNSVDDRPLPKERSEAATTANQDRKPTTTVLPKAATPSQPKPAAPRVAAVPAVAKPVRVQSPTREMPAIRETPAPVIAEPVRELVASVRTPAPSPEPVVPFFETRDVSESPRIEGRVEPRLPAELKSRSINEIVIVRALVSQSGHPSRITVLRRSKAGPELDAVVVAAVNQWTFVPAKKKGEDVSCWFNFGVQVGRPE
jgi:TonB family protein